MSIPYGDISKMAEEMTEEVDVGNGLKDTWTEEAAKDIEEVNGIDVDQIAEDMRSNISIPDSDGRRRIRGKTARLIIVDDVDQEMPISYEVPYRVPVRARPKRPPVRIFLDRPKSPPIQKQPTSIQESKTPSFGNLGQRQLDL